MVNDIMKNCNYSKDTVEEQKVLQIKYSNLPNAPLPLVSTKND